ncbi:MAG: RNA 2',3'-cyclic phosphodiesterase [Rhodobiaceae bacterium]|nr:RNA 2',3'-cyclic phosphodiesterase [Rhodobiaceae bacterium]MCC0041251.1 RNA 2',3'-cyclic phosphodiesterase [Rhodobiaceae bacterium]
MPRLFVGLEIPSDIGALISGLRGGLPGARWIDVANYHITLRFIGDIDERTAAEVADTLWDIHRAPFTLTLRGVESFGSRKPHSIFAAVEASKPLMALQAEVERRMQRIGLAPEQRRYTPHVTVARLRGVSGGAVAGYLGTRGLFRAGPFTVRRFVLFSSRASQGGGPYIVEEAYPLEAGSPQAELQQHA